MQIDSIVFQNLHHDRRRRQIALFTPPYCGVDPGGPVDCLLALDSGPY